MPSSLKLKKNVQKTEIKAHKQGSTKECNKNGVQKANTGNKLKVTNVKRIPKWFFYFGARKIKERTNFIDDRKVAKLVRYPFSTKTIGPSTGKDEADFGKRERN